MPWLEDLADDVDVALRGLRRSPAYPVVAVVTLAVGIGIAASMFSVADAVLQRPLPVADQERVVVLWGQAVGSIRRLPLASDHFDRFRQDPRTLEAVAGVLNAGSFPMAVREGDDVLSLNVAPVTGNFFDVLGSRPLLGRFLTPDDDVKGAPRAMVISRALWRTRFGADPKVIGRNVILHERNLPYTIVGVAPAGLEFPAGANLWVPLTLFTLEAVPIGRLRAGATPAAAGAELTASFQRDGSASWRNVHGVAVPLSQVVIGETRSAVRLLSVAAALLVLIACVNVVNLLLARTVGRTQELAVRCALGARPGRIARLLIAEAGVMGLAGAVLGSALADAFVRGLIALAPPELPRLEEIQLASAPVWWASVVSVLVTVAFASVSALLGARGTSSLTAGDRSMSEPRSRRRLRDGLVVLQIGLAVVVLFGAALLLRSMLNLRHLDLGFVRDNLVMIELAWPDAKLATPEQVSVFYDRLVPELEAIPGVVAVAQTHLMPFEGASGGIDGPIIGRGTRLTDFATSPRVSIEVIGPRYFETLGIPLLHGRDFTGSDRDGSERAIVLSEAVARTFWPNGDALGKQVALWNPKGPDDWWTVIGIVPETRYREMRQPIDTVYVPTRQFMITRTIVVRVSKDPAAILPVARRTVQSVDATASVTSAQTIEVLRDQQLAQPRLSALLLAVFGVSALVLAGVGLYAMLAFAVRRRTRELAIRQALGASHARLRSMVLRQAARLACGGILAGLAAALPAGQLLGSQLFGITARDSVMLVTVASIVGAFALAAAYVPARRATQSDPAMLLRND